MTRFAVCGAVLTLGSALSFGQYTVTILDAPGFDNVYAYGFAGADPVGTAIDTIPPVQHHAVIWSAEAQVMMDLNPVGWAQSDAFGGCDGFQVGSGRTTKFTDWDSALLWTGSASSAVNLHPGSLGFDASAARAATQTHQVGYAFSGTFGNPHAILWSGTAASAVDLNPDGYLGSRANAVVGDRQYGWAAKSAGNSHAAKWNGSANSLVDLHPAEYDLSFITAAADTKQVGSVYGANTNSYYHAGLWVGSAESFVDLNPSWLNLSDATAVSAFGEVGHGIGPTTGTSHAVLWTGTAASAIDLHSFLDGAPKRFLNSYATGIDDQGNVVGYGIASDAHQYAIRWTHVVPEPSSFLVLAIGLVSVLRRRKSVSLSKCP